MTGHGDRPGCDRGRIGADGQARRVIGEREDDPPLLIVERDQSFPVASGEREDPHAADPVGRAILDLSRRQRGVPVPDGAEVPQQGPRLADRAADHRALRYLWHVSLLACSHEVRFGYGLSHGRGGGRAWLVPA
jgi:hypothetical protein